ncbi:hypothetical protein Tco_0596689 [Tanacetum coccineum]
MKDLGEAAYILGIKIHQDRSKRLIGLCQSTYIEKIIKRFYMENSKRGTIPMQEKLKFSKSQGASTPAEIQRMQNIPYASAIGSIMYAVRCTRPDVAYAQNITSRFQKIPSEVHWTAVKNILKYLRNTKDMFLVYGGDTKRDLRVSCYTDAGYLTDADDIKSQTGYVFVLNGGAVDWKSMKQSIFATSSIDAEYIAAFDASKEVVWICKFIYELGVVPTIKEPINMYCDNTGAIVIAKDHGVTKDDNLVDPFTKALAFPKHSELTKKIGMIPASSLISNAYAGNRVKEILLNLNLPDHRSVLTEPEVHLKKEMEILRSSRVLQRHTKELRQEFSQKTIGQTHTEDLNLQVSQDDVSKFIKVKQERVTQEKMPKYSTTPYDQAGDNEHKQNEILFKMMMASKSHEKHLTHKDLGKDCMTIKIKTLSARSDEGMIKRRTGKDVEPLKKSSKFKESAKVQMDIKEPNLDDVANDVDEPQANAIPKIPKKDWFKKFPRHETLDLDWNIIKTVDDAPE